MNSAEWDQRYSGRELVWTSEPNRFLVREAGSLAPGRALDLACGEGRNAVWLAKRGWRVTGVDFSEVAIEKAKRLEHAEGVHADWAVADLLEYEPAPQAFELVMVLYLQVPSVERTPIIRSAASAVVPGGTFVLVGHDSSNIERGYGGPRDPAVLYTAQEVADDLATSGLLVDRVETVQRPVETPEGQRTALDALVVAARP